MGLLRDADSNAGRTGCARIREQVDYMLEKEDLSGFCYTQLTDVEQEENGLFLL